MKRIISLVLILALICTIPIYADANFSTGGEDIKDISGAGNATATNKKGTWSNQHQGMRIYAIDKNGCLVSNVIDVVKDDCYTKIDEAKAAKAKGKASFWSFSTTKTGETPDASKWKILSEKEANELFFDKVCELYEDYAENPEVSGITNVEITGDTLTWDEYERDEEGRPITPTTTTAQTSTTTTDPTTSASITPTPTSHTIQKSSASIPR